MFKAIAHLRQCALVLAMLFGGPLLCTNLARAVPSNNSSPVSAPVGAADQSARDLFAQYKPGIVQVRVLLNSAKEQSSLGSGFVVHADTVGGVWVMTNHHVVAALAVDPDKFSLELRGTDERRVPAQLVAVDAVNDLAVLYVPSPSGQAALSSTWPSLRWRETPLPHGSKLYALGNPLQLGFVISEGNANGEVEGRWQRQHLFSGALNPGMSGGPAMDADGRVVGVNVSKRLGADLISFLVPSEFAKALLVKALQTNSGKPSPESGQWRKQVVSQVLAHQAVLSDALVAGSAMPAETTASLAKPRDKRPLRFSVSSVAGRDVVSLDGKATSCRAGTRDGDDLRFQREKYSCSLNAGMNVSPLLQAGTVGVRHMLLRNNRLSTPQFLHLRGFSNEPNWTNPKDYTRAQCTDADMLGVQGRRYRVSFCVRAFKRFENLYLYEVDAVQIDDSGERLQSRLDLSGFTFENAQRLSKQFLERLQ